MGIESSQRRYPRRRRRQGGDNDSTRSSSYCFYGEETVEAYRSKPLPPLPNQDPCVQQKQQRQERQLVNGTTAQQVTEVSRLIHHASNHLGYAISGYAAMVLHGRHGGPSLDAIDVVCSEDALAVFGNWALTKGFHRSPDGDPHVFSFATAATTAARTGVGEGTEQRRTNITVRIRALRYFDALRVQLMPLVTACGGQANGISEEEEEEKEEWSEMAVACVLSLPALADVLADGYVEDLARVRSSSQDQAAVADDMRWVLRSIEASSGPRHKRQDDLLSPSTAPHVASEAFWIPFTLSFPDTVALFQAAGLSFDWEHINAMPAPSPVPPSVVLTPSTPPSSFLSPNRASVATPSTRRRHSAPQASVVKKADSTSHRASLEVPPRTHSRRRRETYARGELVPHTRTDDNTIARVQMRQPALRSTRLRQQQPHGDYVPLRDEYRRPGVKTEFMGG